MQEPRIEYMYAGATWSEFELTAAIQACTAECAAICLYVWKPNQVEVIQKIDETVYTKMVRLLVEHTIAGMFQYSDALMAADGKLMAADGTPRAVVIEAWRAAIFTPEILWTELSDVYCSLADSTLEQLANCEAADRSCIQRAVLLRQVSREEIVDCGWQVLTMLAEADSSSQAVHAASTTGSHNLMKWLLSHQMSPFKEGKQPEESLGDGDRRSEHCVNILMCTVKIAHKWEVNDLVPAVLDALSHLHGKYKDGSAEASDSMTQYLRTESSSPATLSELLRGKSCRELLVKLVNRRCTCSALPHIQVSLFGLSSSHTVFRFSVVSFSLTRHSHNSRTLLTLAQTKLVAYVIFGIQSLKILCQSVLCAQFLCLIRYCFVV